MSEKMSVIIPSFNSWQTIGYVLNGLAAQKGKEMISEIIIVDSSDDEKTKEIISGYKSDKIRIIDAGVKVIAAASRNLGAREARGDLIVFLDADTYPAENWLLNILKAYRKGSKVGGGSVEIPEFQNNNPLVAAQYYLQVNEYMPVGRDRIKKFVSGCNMFCEKKLFRKIGGFPELRASEEVLFGLKANELAELWFIPEAKASHVFRTKWKSFLLNQIVLGKYIIIYRKSYYRKFIYGGIAPLVLLPAFVLVKFFRIVFRISKAGRHHTLRFLSVLPVFMIGLLFWSFGFIKGCLSEEGMNDNG